MSQIEFFPLLRNRESPKENHIKIYRKKLVEEYFRRARILQEKQTFYPINTESLFCGSLYGLLAANENYKNQMSAYNLLIEQGLDNPQSILKQLEQFEGIILKTMYPFQRARRMVGFCEWWEGSDLPEEIVKDALADRKREFELRNKLTDAPGVGLKTASLILNTAGYQNVVPIDRWVIRFLYGRGLIKNDPTQRGEDKSGGISKGIFLECEKKLIEEARKMNVSPLEYQLAVWCAHSRYKGIPDEQLEIPMSRSSNL
ncbi:MAG: hypothetical protein KKG60_04230 [Nanoarchaeota archaeon]|nr:hypothetical protein [Nanoarchaeota archaeon]